MKKIIYTLVLLIHIMIIAGCQDKNGPDINNEITKELIFNSASEVCEIQVDSDKAWNVISCPEWATPLSYVGESGDLISLFIEDNLDESDRYGEIVVLAGDVEIIYNLTQRSPLSDDENGAILSEKTLKITNGVGIGVDVFGTSSTKYAFKKAVFNANKMIQTLAKIGESHAYSIDEQYYSETESIVGTTVESISNQLSVNAGIEVDIAGFKGNVTGKFSSTENTNEEKGYAIRSVKHITSTRYLRPGVLRWLVENQIDSLFQSSFRNTARDIQKNPNDIESIEYLVDTYGTHIAVNSSLGGELELCVEMSSTEKISEMEIHAALNLTHEMVNADANFDMTESEKNITKNTKISLRTSGGTNVFHTMTPHASFEEAMAIVQEAESLDKWVSLIKEGSSLVVVDIQTYPIYELMPDEASRNAVREYIVNTYQKKKLGHGPLKYLVKGFNNSDAAGGYLNIPEINVRLEYYNEDVPEISTTELSTIVYSGSLDEMNYDCGFFIGSLTKQPGKLRKGRDGNFKYEPFSDLNYEEVTELYVSPSGSVTIATHSTDNYATLEFTSANPIELSNIWRIESYDPDVITYKSENISILNDYPRSEFSLQFTDGYGNMYGDAWEKVVNGKHLTLEPLEILFLKENNLNEVISKLTYDDYSFRDTIKFNLPKGTKYIALKMNLSNDDYFDYMLGLIEFDQFVIKLESPATPRWK